MAALMTGMAFASPALRRVVKLQQADGSVVEALLSGDENGVVYTDLQTGKVLKRVAAETPAQSPIRRVGSTPVTGEPHYAVILIEYADMAFSNLCMNGDTEHHYDTTEELYNDFFNGDNYGFMNCNGSVGRYFADQSAGLYKPHYDIIGRVTLSRNHDYYGASHGQTAEGIREALTLAYEAGMIAAEKLSEWDNNQDGVVDAVYAVFAGYNEAYCGKSEYIWAHNSSFSSLTLDNERPSLSTYVCSSELFGSPGQNLQADGIGTAVHEFSHVLGLPDYYDVNGAKGENAVYGMEYFSVMDQGMYNRNGLCPTSYTTFDRMLLGWFTPDELPLSNDSIAVVLPLLNDSLKAFIYRNPNNPDEAFIFENHGKNGWDRYFGGSSNVNVRGMLITHLDYNANLWRNNRPNTDCNHPHYTPLPADGELTAYKYQAYQATDLNNPDHEAWYAAYRVGLTNDLWPCEAISHYTYRNKFEYGGPYTTLSKETTPKAVFFDGTEAAFVMENIEEHFTDEVPSDNITFTIKPFGYVPSGIETIECPAAEDNGLKMVDGKLMIGNGNKRYDLLGRIL